MSIGIIAFSERGSALGERIRDALAEEGSPAELTRCVPGGLAPWIKEHFHRDEALVLIGSCGIAVRAVAPFLESKTKDPAVVVVDETSSFAVALLSGHLGGANALAEKLARLTGAAAVVTTATDRNGVFAVDAWAKSQGLRVANPGRIKDVSAKLLQGEAIRLRSLFPIEGSPPEGIIMDGEGCDVLVSHLAGDGEGALLLVPPAVSLGVGCKRGTGAEAIDAAFEEILRTSGVHPLSAGFAFSLDRKADEPGILEFCRRRGLEYRTFSAEELAAAEGRFSASDFVRRVTGIDNVCERAAVLGSGGGTLLAEKQAGNGVTMALALKEPALRF